MQNTLKNTYTHTHTQKGFHLNVASKHFFKPKTKNALQKHINEPCNNFILYMLLYSLALFFSSSLHLCFLRSFLHLLLQASPSNIEVQQSKPLYVSDKSQIESRKWIIKVLLQNRTCNHQVPLIIYIYKSRVLT
jgi:hypothetical protein